MRRARWSEFGAGRRQGRWRRRLRCFANGRVERRWTHHHLTCLFISLVHTPHKHPLHFSHILNHHAVPRPLRRSQWLLVRRPRRQRARAGSRPARCAQWTGIADRQASTLETRCRPRPFTVGRCCNVWSTHHSQSLPPRFLPRRRTSYDQRFVRLDQVGG